jgi:GntP family gluconate:H+ symporter
VTALVLARAPPATPAVGSTQLVVAALLGIAVEAGSLFFSLVDDAGFWLVKARFGPTVGQTIRSWSVMETVISVVGLQVVLLLSVITRTGR